MPLKYLEYNSTKVFFSGELIGLYIILIGLNFLLIILLYSVAVTGNPLYFSVIQLDTVLQYFIFLGLLLLGGEIFFSVQTLLKNNHRLLILH